MFRTDEAGVAATVRDVIELSCWRLGGAAPGGRNRWGRKRCWGSHQRSLLMNNRECCEVRVFRGSGPPRIGPSADQIFALITPEGTLSTPAEEYEVTAKYHVPEGRLLN